MSIFKESFKEFVGKQIGIRQEKVSNNDRTYFLQRQCTIRMASGVDVNGSYTLASNNVLQGGTTTATTVDRILEDGTVEDAFALKNRGGFDVAYDSPSDGYGYVPMPGITSVNIKTKTAYGSLRGATVNFECHSIKQLSTLEKLYMRPGYPCLLEWGWLPFIDNDGDQIFNMPFLSDDGEFFSDPKKGYFKSSSGDVDIQDALQRRIREKKQEFAGNYDGLYGIVKNFNYSVRPDGGFSCMTELVAVGEVLDSLKGVISEDDPTKHSLEDILLKFNDYAIASTLGGRDNDFWWGGITSTSSLGGENTDERRRLREERFNQKAELEKYFENKEIDYIVHNENPVYDKNGADIYINWGTLTKLINDSINKDDEGNSLIELVTQNRTTDKNGNVKYTTLLWNKNTIPSSVNNLMETPYDATGILNNLDISVNPKICLFPSQIEDIFGDAQEKSDILAGSGVADEGAFTRMLDSTQPEELPGTKELGGSLTGTRQIKNIYFNVAYLYRTFRSQYYTTNEDKDEIENEDFALGKYIKTIWDDVNISCGNGHNFQLITDFDNGKKCKIIDLEIKDPPKKDNLTLVKTLSTDSIVRDFNYDLTVPSSLTATIAIAAQNPDNPGDLNQVTFSAFNKNIRNRFVSNSSKNVRGNKSTKKSISYIHRGVFESKYPWPDIDNPSYLEHNIFTLNDLLMELRIYLDRLKGYMVYKTDNSVFDRDKVLDESFTPIETPLLTKANSYNAAVDVYGNPDSTYEGRVPHTKAKRFKLAGNPFVDFSEINSANISAATTALKEAISIKNELSRYNLTEITKDNGGRLIETEVLSEKNPDITSIIPLKFNMKLDGISGIVIGNVFRLDESRLPESYNNSNIAFVVFGEEQTIDNQDWTTTITGQVILLPI